MSEKPESDEFEEEDAEDTAPGGDDVDVDHIMRDVDSQRRRAPKGAEPAWRRLERVMEERRTAELMSDFDDYEIAGGDPGAAADPNPTDAEAPESAEKAPAKEEENPLAFAEAWISSPDLVALRELTDVVGRAKRERLNGHGRLTPAGGDETRAIAQEIGSAHRACGGTCRPPRSSDRCPSAPFPIDARPPHSLRPRRARSSAPRPPRGSRSERSCRNFAMAKSSG